MANIKKLTVLIVLAGVVAAGGCQKPRTKAHREVIAPTSTELRKTELIQLQAKRYGEPDVHYELGKIYQGEGLWDKAITEFRVAKGYNPVHWDAAAAIVKSHLLAGKQDLSLLSAENYINEASYSASSSLLLGKAFQKEFMEEEALECYKQALRIAPDSAGLNKHVGFYYLSKKDYVRAEQYLRRSFEISPSAEVSGALGRLGIAVQIPRKQADKTSGKKLDKMLANSEKKAKKK